MHTRRASCRRNRMCADIPPVRSFAALPFAPVKDWRMACRTRAPKESSQWCSARFPESPGSELSKDSSTGNNKPSPAARSKQFVTTGRWCGTIVSRVDRSDDCHGSETEFLCWKNKMSKNRNKIRCFLNVFRQHVTQCTCS